MAYIELNGFDEVEFTEVPGSRADSADQAGPSSIRLIGLTKCVYCHHAMKLLKSRGVPYGYAFLDQIPSDVRGPLLRALKSHVSPAALLFPVVMTDQEVFIAGFNADVWADAGIDTGGTPSA